MVNTESAIAGGAAQTQRGGATPQKLVFCGTPEFAVPTLAALHAAGHDIALVLTQPDRPSGRGMQLAASPVKQWALANSLPVDQPETIRSNDVLRAKLDLIRPDAIIVVAYGRIIPPWLLALPRLGNINLHGSLLPKYRGAAPIQWAIANGEAVTGVTTMLLEEGLDTGPVLERAELPIPESATAADLFLQLAVFGAPLILSTLAGLAAGALAPQPQDDSRATQAPILSREDGRIDFHRSARDIYNRWRGFQPWPGAWTLLERKKFTIHRMALSEANPVMSKQNLIPGKLLFHDAQLHVACGAGSTLQLLDVQMEGKRSIPAGDFLRGYPRLAGAQLG